MISGAGDSGLTIGIPIYTGFDLLDVAGPFEIFTWMSWLQPQAK